ncbi:MAG: large repetitive protein, partial [Solirubrobacteraceae bacterium]|nr:large repetitive protein [Solirubrobacteraceae bacterium]
MAGVRTWGTDMQLHGCARPGWPIVVAMAAIGLALLFACPPARAAALDTAANSAPTCNPVDLGDVPHDNQAFGSTDCQDADADPLSYSAGTPTHGTADAFDGELTYTPDAGYVGHDSFTYTANDGTDDSAPATVTVNVVNNTPECDDSSQDLRTGKPITLSLSCFDIDGDQITITKVGGPSHGTLGSIDSDAGTVDYTPNAGYTGPDSFTFRASDGAGQSAPSTFTLSVTPNHAPSCDSTGSLHTKVNAPLGLFVFCDDPDAQDQALTYTKVAGSGPSHGALSAFDQGAATYTPANNFSGVDSFVVRASDGTLSADTQKVVHVANGPLCTPPTAFSVRTGRDWPVLMDCTQPDDATDPLQFVITAQPAKGTLDPSGTSDEPFRTYTPNAGATGADSFSYRATSGTAQSPVVTQQITTGPNVNHAPDCSSTFPDTVYSGRPSELGIFCEDADFDPIQFTAGAKPAHGTSSTSADHAVVYLADTGYTGPDAVPFGADDGHGGTTTGSWPVDVAAPQAPSCFQGPIADSVRPGGHVTLQLECSSPQDDPQSYAAPTAPSKGSLGAFQPDGSVVYTAGQNATGQDTFSLRATNAVGDSEAQAVTITIDPNFNRAPSCFPNSFQPKHVVTATPTPIDFATTCTDPDGDPLTFTRSSQPGSGGTVTAGPAASLTYTSPGGFTGPDSFGYVAHDDHGGSSPVSTYDLDVVTSLAPTCTALPTLSLRP